MVDYCEFLSFAENNYLPSMVFTTENPYSKLFWAQLFQLSTLQRKYLHINDSEVIRKKIQSAIGKDYGLLSVLKKRILRWFGHYYIKNIWYGHENSARDSKRIKVERKTEEEVGNNIKDWTTMDFD